MKAAIITGIGQISIETVEDPKCEDREVIIEVAAAGICGTDLHILEGEFAPSKERASPIVEPQPSAGIINWVIIMKSIIPTNNVINIFFIAQI